MAQFVHFVCLFSSCSIACIRFVVIVSNAQRLLLVDPLVQRRLVLLDLVGGEPESNLLLCVFNAVRAVADVASDIDGVVATDGTRGRGKRVGGTEES